MYFFLCLLLCISYIVLLVFCLDIRVQFFFTYMSFENFI